MKRTDLHKLMRTVHGSHGTFQRTYWVKSEQPTAQTFAFWGGQRVHTVNQKAISPADHVTIHNGLFTGRTSSEAQVAMAAIAKVHHVPTSLPVLNIRPSHSIDSNGRYFAGNAHTSEMGVRTGLNDTQSTVAHEYGHFLDHHLFGTGHEGVGAMGTYRRNPEMKGLMTAIYNSASVRSLVDRHKANRADHDARQEHVSKYLLMPPELLARAYAQWISVRSGSRAMQSEISRDREAWGNHGYRAQWQDREFEPIAREFDAMFKRRGLLR